MLIVKTHDLSGMFKGWFIGPFQPSLLTTSNFECAVKRYQAGDRESSHMHRIATEFTVIIEGKVRMNGKTYERDTIIEIPPGEATDFEAINDVITMVVKVPAIPGDKYEC